MRFVVVYDSQFGNTKTIAEAIALGLQEHGRVQLIGLDNEAWRHLEQADLLVVGCPTQAHGMTALMRKFLNSLATAKTDAMAAATFDTRFRMPVFLSGSAARTIASNLSRLGIDLFGAPESFFVTRDGHRVEAGEVERATAWAASLATRFKLACWSAA